MAGRVSMAGQVNCLYCGKKIPADSSYCPGCSAVSHFQGKGYRAGIRRKFLVWFMILVVFCTIMILWLPR